MSAQIAGSVRCATYKNYTYQNMNLKGKINRGAYNGNLDSKDPNANLHLAASGVYSDKNPTIKTRKPS